MTALFLRSRGVGFATSGTEFRSQSLHHTDTYYKGIGFALLRGSVRRQVTWFQDSHRYQAPDTEVSSHSKACILSTVSIAIKTSRIQNGTHGSDNRGSPQVCDF